jgi:hypothetical protein
MTASPPLPQHARLWCSLGVLGALAFGYFCLGIAMNLTSRSPAERWTMVPTRAVLALASLAIAVG